MSKAQEKIEIERDPTEHIYLTIPEFAARVKRTRQQAYLWIKNSEMPAGSVVKVQGALRIDWTVYQSKIEVVN